MPFLVFSLSNLGEGLEVNISYDSFGNGNIRLAGARSSSSTMSSWSESSSTDYYSRVRSNVAYYGSAIYIEY